MTSAAIARFAQIEPTPWKNGLGVTTQLAVHPPGAAAEDFEWRVSIARLDAAAPFSHFEGVDRCLAVLQGEMQLDGLEEPALLTPNSQPVRFGGGEAVRARVVRGPVLDLNIMYKISRWQASMSRMRWSMATRFTLDAWEMICSLSQRMDVRVGDKVVELGLFDLLGASLPMEIEVCAAQPAEAYVIEFRPLAG